jgi:hypothetical protein
MAAAQNFNATAMDLIRDLNTAVPGHTELAMAESVADTFFRAQPGNRMFMDNFWKVAAPHGDAIRAKDEAVLTETVSVFMPGETFEALWSTLTPENKDIVFRYLAALWQFADEAHAAPKEPSALEASPEGRTLFLVYNNMWKEFLAHLSRSLADEDHFAAGVKEAMGRLDGLMESKGKDADVVYAVMMPSMRPVLPDLGASPSQEDLMKYMMPPGDPVDVVHGDGTRLEGVRFRLSRTMTMDELLEGVVSSEDVLQLASYWHYLKLITFTLASCPKELLEVMSGIAQSMIPAV